MLEELKDILAELFYRHGLTPEVIRLSQVIDKLINQEMIESNYKDYEFCKEQCCRDCEKHCAYRCGRKYDKK